MNSVTKFKAKESNLLIYFELLGIGCYRVFLNYNMFLNLLVVTKNKSVL